ncbi:ABC transporter ATP-binding protein [Granulosicoccus antarcticus]|uniref:Glutathione import ATP-binding protein GsiA n=1 Tax=Granulosicoccus antarcticus IMCC3135 TaxID=1192854 RepID=A0A2Z2NNM1_9GAMM|nr:ABC transporter ATP-binding protein [Granulosicoccus antarcticus]ASJ73072.1 Glutathione import ATP-binding protein GsiA [Granulosicoccus antarcticus IMCC3135]
MNDLTPILRIENYSLSYATRAGTVRILDGIELEIKRGEVLGLVGESGSAKSSLANAIMRDLPGKVASESGRMLFCAEDILGVDENAMQAIRGNRIAMVMQNASTALNPTLSLGDHVIEMLKQHGKGLEGDVKQLAVEALDLVGLPDPVAMMKRYAHEVSGGEKQRVVLAMALACEPELILFDEPTSALDATTAATLLDLFALLQQRTGVSALFISHDLGVVSSVADRVAVIYGGRVVEEAQTSQLFSNPQHPYTRALLASLPRPSDTRTGRQLATRRSRPAPRLGPAPSCIYSQSCAYHEPDRCDSGIVGLQADKGHAVACVKVVAEFAGTEQPLQQRATLIRSQSRPQTMMALSGVSVSYGRTSWLDSLRGKTRKVHAVIDVNLTLIKGETLALVGESGCGKSTLAKTLAGLVGFEGELSLSGTPVRRIDEKYRSRVQIIFQNPDSSLNPRHSINTILSRPLALYRTSLAAAERLTEVKALLQRVQLPEHYASRYPHQLSGGEKQRVAIARALAANPEVIICDEVTSGLDASVQASIALLLKSIQRESGTSIIFITHDLGILRHLAHRVAVMYLGEVVELMDINDMDLPPYHPYTEALLSSLPSIDPLTSTRRIRLHGALPKRTERVTGCAFQSRCPHHLGEQCVTEQPPRQLTADGHEIKCHIDINDLSSHAPLWHELVIQPETTS